MTGGSATLQGIAIMEMIYGGFHIFYKKSTKMNGDKDGFTGLLYGTVIVMFGQTLLLMTLKGNKKPMVAALFFKAILCGSSLIFAMSLMTSNNKMQALPLILYCFFGIPFCALFQQWSRMGTGPSKRLGDMSEAERAASGGGAPQSGMPGSGMPPSMDMGMGGPPPSGGYGYGQNPGMMPAMPQSGGYGMPQSGGYGYNNYAPPQHPAQMPQMQGGMVRY